MDLILRAALRHKSIIGLIMVEVALCFALTANGGALLMGKLSPMYQLNLPPDSNSLYVIDAGEASAEGADQTEERRASLAREDLAKLAAISGVNAVGQTNSVPVGGQMETASVSINPRRVPQVEDAAIYAVTLGGLKALGLRALEGRNLAQEDLAPYASDDPAVLGRSVLITESLKTRLFGADDAVARDIFYGDSGIYRATVVGIVPDISKPILSGSGGSSFSIVRVVEPFPGGLYLVRANREDSSGFVESMRRAISSDAPWRANANIRSLGGISSDYFKADRALAELLAAVLAAVIAVCVIGISGITSYWIRQRHRSVGIRRALGANRNQIFMEFVAENLMISTGGVLIGLMVYVASSRALTGKFGLPSLNVHELIVLALAFEAVCIAAVLKSISVAARLSPIEATRL